MSRWFLYHGALLVIVQLQQHLAQQQAQIQQLQTQVADLTARVGQHSQGSLIDDSALARPMRLCFNYTADDLATVGGELPDLIIQHYDTSLAPPSWVEITTRSHGKSRLCVSTTQLGLFELFGRSSTSSAPPDQAGQSGAPSSVLATSASAAAGGSLNWPVAALLGEGIVVFLVRRLFT